MVEFRVACEEPSRHLALVLVTDVQLLGQVSGGRAVSNRVWVGSPSLDHLQVASALIRWQRIAAGETIITHHAFNNHFISSALYQGPRTSLSTNASLGLRAAASGAGEVFALGLHRELDL